MVSLRRGTRLGKYRLDRRIGRGSFAEVWKARDGVEQRYVALKIALPEMLREYDRKELEHEARILPMTQTIASTTVRPQCIRRGIRTEYGGHGRDRCHPISRGHRVSSASRV